MGDWWDEYDLPEGGEVVELPEIVEVQVLTTKSEVVVADASVLGLIERAPPAVVKALGNPYLPYATVEDKRSLTVEFDLVVDEFGSRINGVEHVLAYLWLTHKTEFRSYVWKYFDELAQYAESLPVDRALRVYRYMRKVTPALDKVSNKSMVWTGYSTIHKVKNLTEKAYRLAGEGCVVYGVGRPQHDMAWTPGVVKCYDTFSVNKGLFEHGNLLDWKEHDLPSVVVSDACIGEQEQMGFFVPKDYYQVYRDMLRAGKYVVCKCKVTDRPFDRCVDAYTYKDHNLEVFLLVSPVESENVYKIDWPDMEDEARNANKMRLRDMRERDYPYIRDPVTVTRDLLDQVAMLSKVPVVTGQSNVSVDGQVLDRYVQLDKEWKRLCKDPDARVPEGFVGDDFELELPAIALDVGHLAKDKVRLFYSLFVKFKMKEFDSDLGWVFLDESC